MSVWELIHFNRRPMPESSTDYCSMNTVGSSILLPPLHPFPSPDSPLQLTGLVHLIPSPGTYNFTIPIVDNSVYEGPRRGTLTALYSAVRPCPSQSVETSTSVVIMDDDSELVL